MDEPTSIALERNELRMIGDGVHLPDLVQLRRTITSWSQWFDSWAELAASYEDAGEQAERDGRLVTAGECFWQSSICWQYAQFLWFHEPSQRLHGQRRKVETYRRSAPYLLPPAERVDIPFEDTSIPGYFRSAEGDGRAPCALLIGGLESTKEESYRFENLLLRRGVSTFAFDGPGQGEYFEQRPLAEDFERYASAVLDHVVARPDVDADRVGVLGRSLGGYLAVRAAALEPRLRACVAWGALFDLAAFFDQMEPRTQDGFCYITGISDRLEARAAAERAIDLTAVAAELDRPLYILHGARDPLIPIDQAYKLDAHTRQAPTTLVIEPGGDHCAHNLYHRVRPAMADWLAQHLEAG